MFSIALEFIVCQLYLIKCQKNANIKAGGVHQGEIHKSHVSFYKPHLHLEKRNIKITQRIFVASLDAVFISLVLSHYTQTPLSVIMGECQSKIYSARYKLPVISFVISCTSLNNSAFGVLAICHERDNGLGLGPTYDTKYLSGITQARVMFY